MVSPLLSEATMWHNTCKGMIQSMDIEIEYIFSLPASCIPVYFVVTIASHRTSSSQEAQNVGPFKIESPWCATTSTNII